MTRTIRCECGYVARGDSDDGVIEAIRAHMRTDHPALLDTVGRVRTCSGGSSWSSDEEDHDDEARRQHRDPTDDPA